MRQAHLLRGTVAALLAVDAGAWVLVRRVGIFQPWVVAGLAAATVVLAGVAAGAELVRLRASFRIATLASALLFGGIAAGGGAGLVGWMRSVQGFLLLAEGEALPVDSIEALRRHWGGPLGAVSEIEGSLTLDRLELEAVGLGFRPVSRVTRRNPRGETVSFDSSPGKPGVVGGLRLHQGAFGFAPRIVVTRLGRTVFDEHVPFRTAVLADRAVAFEGDVEVEGVRIEGEVDLSTLDRRMRGHPTLLIRAKKDGKQIGSGVLELGHFAEVEGDYRVGYAGMRRWSEIDVRRRGVAAWVRAGLIVAATGAILWPLAAWRKW